MPKIFPEENVRQGRWGWHGLTILIVVALIPGADRVGRVERYGQSIDATPPAGQVPKG